MFFYKKYVNKHLFRKFIFGQQFLILFPFDLISILMKQFKILFRWNLMSKHCCIWSTVFFGFLYNINRLIDLAGRVFANDPGNQGSIPGRVIPKTLKMVLDTSLLSTQQYKVSMKGKVEQSRERSSALPYTSV